MKTSPITKTKVIPHIAAQVLTRLRPSRRPYISLAIRENARTYAEEENRANSTLITSMVMDCSVEPMTVETTVCALLWKLSGMFSAMNSSVRVVTWSRFWSRTSVVIA